MTDLTYLRAAIAEAQAADANGEVPVGAVVAHQNKIIRPHLRKRSTDPGGPNGDKKEVVRKSNNRLNPPRPGTLQRERIDHRQSPRVKESLPQRPSLRHAHAQLLHQPCRPKPLRIPPR